MTVNFVGIGVQKGGTSTLHDILKQHAEIFLPAIKESHFFDLTENYNKGLGWLEKTYFSERGNKKLLGEITPDYLYMPEVPNRIYNSLGKNVKFIVIFRNPVERAVSHYNMMVRLGLETKEFWTAINNEEKQIGVSELSKIRFSYITRGYYATQLKRYLDIFDKENFLFLTFENDIVKNIEKTIEQVQSFLGVSYQHLNCNIVSNEAFAPKFAKINQISRNNKLIKSIFAMMPGVKKIKNYLISKLLKANKTSSKQNLFKLDISEKIKISNKYFCEEINELEKLTGLNLNMWKYE